MKLIHELERLKRLSDLHKGLDHHRYNDFLYNNIEKFITVVRCADELVRHLENENEWSVYRTHLSSLLDELL